MDVILFSFLEYGLKLTDGDMKRLSSEQIHYVDFFYPRKRLFESRIFKTGLHAKFINTIVEYRLRISTRAFDSIFILKCFGADNLSISKLTWKSINLISTLTRLSKEDIRKIIGKSELKYAAIIQALEDYKSWQNVNSGYLIEVILLEYIQTGNTDNLLYKVQTKMEARNVLVSIQQIAYKLAELEAERIIKISDNKVQLLPLSLSLLLSYNFDSESIFSEKLKGKTHEDIGKRLGKTKSRIQQQFNSFFTYIPDLLEDKIFGNIYTTYSLSKDDFLKYIHNSVSLYYYLDSKYTKGSKSILEFFEDYQVSNEVINEYIKANNKFINSNQEILIINHRNIFDDFILNNKTKRFNYENSRQEYNRYSSKYGLKDYSSEEARAFQAIVDNSQYVIRSVRGRYRYFNTNGLDDIEIKYIIEAFNIPEGIYGADKIYQINIDLMRLLGLENGYEFLDLIKVINLEIPYVKKVTRRSEVQIGEQNKFEFIQSILRDFNGENIYEVVDLISSEYGLQTNSLLTYVFTFFKDIIVDNRIAIPAAHYNEESLNCVLSQMLINKIYLIHEFNRQLSEKLAATISVNNHMLRPHGYYTSRRYIIKQDYSNHNEAMEAEILQHRYFKIPQSELAKDTLFYNTRNYLMKTYRLFRFSEESYISRQVLQQANIKTDHIINFIKAVIDYMRNGSDFYTLPKLMHEGFDHDFFSLGFENVFYGSIILQSEEIRAIHTKPYIFYLDDGISYTFQEFLYLILKEQISIDYQDFLDVLNKTYGFSIEQYELKYKLNGTEAYYSNETEKFYYNKNQYYLEVYGE